MITAQFDELIHPSTRVHSNWPWAVSEFLEGLLEKLGEGCEPCRLPTDDGEHQ